MRPLQNSFSSYYIFLHWQIKKPEEAVFRAPSSL